MDTNLTAAILFLASKFKHSNVTDLKKGRLSNHDACAYIFWSCGTLKVREIIAALNAWRRYTDEDAGQTLSFSYLFNTSGYGGYGFTGSHVMSSGEMRTVTNFARENTDCEVWRRHYWFRASRGTYAPTLVCAQRMNELGFTCEQSPEAMVGLDHDHCKTHLSPDPPAAHYRAHWRAQPRTVLQ
jgi:hypothetical protein